MVPLVPIGSQTAVTARVLSALAVLGNLKSVMQKLIESFHQAADMPGTSRYCVEQHHGGSASLRAVAKCSIHVVACDPDAFRAGEECEERAPGPDRRKFARESDFNDVGQVLVSESSMFQSSTAFGVGVAWASVWRKGVFIAASAAAMARRGFSEAARVADAKPATMRASVKHRDFSLLAEPRSHRATRCIHWNELWWGV